jgi:signal transduction histidine kinase
MTIRARLTIWYAGILFVSVLLITGLSYHEFDRERQMARLSHGNEEENDAPEDILQITVICGIPAAIVGLAGGWWLMRKAMAPVTALTEAASRINEGNLNKQLPRTGNGDELDRLTEVFNAMTARLDTSFNRIREFTLHASHELKTPLTVMHGEVETALADCNLSQPQREALLSQLDEVQRLTKIVDGLSLLTKADAGQVILKRDPVRLDDLVRDCVADAQILAQPQRVNVELVRCDKINVLGDRHRLRQLLLNLTDNAIKYNQATGTLKLELCRVEKFAELKVSNTGPGIPPEMLGRVFERFFRCDTSHGKDVDGCGLGLSIAQWIVTAHEGTIGIESEPGKWTTVTVRLPVAVS